MHTLRLLKSYRGYRAGSVIQATPRLAEFLVGNGTAVAEAQRSLPTSNPERSVAATAKVETR